MNEVQSKLWKRHDLYQITNVNHQRIQESGQTNEYHFDGDDRPFMRVVPMHGVGAIAWPLVSALAWVPPRDVPNVPANLPIGADVIHVPPSTAFPPHNHPGHHILVVLFGQGYCTIADKPEFISLGDVMWIEAKEGHGISTDHTSSLTLLSIGMPHVAADSPERMEVEHD